ncbi:hypothetical protein V8C35DRAFT_309393 [Trichoderma chlorosporum]
MSSLGKAKGFALRRNNSCESDQLTCGNTWDNWQACCPGNSYCPSKDKAYSTNICCPDSSNCTTLIINPPICADSSWSLYTVDGKTDATGSFCCEAGQQGFYVSSLGWVGCEGPGARGNPDYILLAPRTTGTVSTTSGGATTTSGSATTTSGSATTTSGSTSASATAPSTSSNAPAISSNKISAGAVAGGVVGGVVVLAIVVAAAFFFLRRRKRQSSSQELNSPYSSHLSTAKSNEQSAQFAELGPMARPVELMGSHSVHELPGST